MLHSAEKPSTASAADKTGCATKTEAAHGARPVKCSGERRYALLIYYHYWNNPKRCARQYAICGVSRKNTGGARLRLQRKLRTKHLRQKNGLGKRPVRFFVFTSAVTIRLEIHSEAVSPEEALPEPAAWGLAGERIKTAFLGELHAGQDASQYPVLRYKPETIPPASASRGVEGVIRYFLICRPIFGRGFTSYHPQAWSKARAAGHARPCRQPLHVGR